MKAGMKAIPTATRHLMSRSRSSIRCDRKVSWLSSIGAAGLAAGLVARGGILDAELHLRRRRRRPGLGRIVRRGRGLVGQLALDRRLRLAQLVLHLGGL